MSYLVLARKWRPKRFAELVGQEHVVRALSNALDSGRVHHAFLFTGTRGVGKTTIARIFAKSLNCERGTSADPCGECGACRDIDAGRYIDLLEIDAASNTGVDDVREVIENAQYMPSRGKYKVYLIDEVHMLSKAAFNALLKTLEEPPEHVKFLLATTDPQKLPVTVLSRCLQFNLKRLDEGQIGGQMTRILAAEQIPADAGAIEQLAKAADGSLRDGLSLLDQAIAYAGGELRNDVVAAMLGTVDRTQVAAMLEALTIGDGALLFQTVAALADFSPDWSAVLDALSEGLHRIQVRQLVPGAPLAADGIDADRFATRLRAEVVQLWYQMALAGQRDLPLAPSPRAGFEMVVLRMLAFRPAGSVPATPTMVGESSASSPAAQVPGPIGTAVIGSDVLTQREAAPASALVSASTAPDRSGAGTEPDLPPWPVADQAVVSVPAPVVRDNPVAASRVSAADEALAADYGDRDDAYAPSDDTPHSQELAEGAPGLDILLPAASLPSPAAVSTATGAPGSMSNATDWLDFVDDSGLGGPARELAANCAFDRFVDGTLHLVLPEGFDYLHTERFVEQMGQALSRHLNELPRIMIRIGQTQAETLHARQDRERSERQNAAQAAFTNHATVRELIEQQGARVVPDSIRPYQE